MIFLAALVVAGTILAMVSAILLQPRLQIRLGLGTVLLSLVLLIWALVAGGLGAYYWAGLTQILGLCLTVVGLIREGKRRG